MKKASFVRKVTSGATPHDVYRMDPPVLGCKFMLFGHGPGTGFLLTACDRSGGPTWNQTGANVGTFIAGGDKDTSAAEVFGAFGYETEGGAE